MNITFHTNLDHAKPFVAELTSRDDWPHGVIPRMGERIEFWRSGYSKSPRERCFELEVVGVTYALRNRDVSARIDLHIPSWQQSMSVREWEEWFERHMLGRDL